MRGVQAFRGSWKRVAIAQCRLPERGRFLGLLQGVHCMHAVHAASRRDLLFKMQGTDLRSLRLLRVRWLSEGQDAATGAEAGR